MKNLAQFLLKAGNLKKVHRAGWVREDMPEPETVAEHSWRVAFLALILGKELGIDSNKLVKMALVHDLEEIETNDPVTQRGKKQVSHHNQKSEKDIVRSVLGDVSNLQEIYSLWEAHIPESGPLKTRYSDLLYQLGKIATAWQALEYELGGADPRKLDEFWENAHAYVKEAIITKLLEELESLRKT